MALTLEQFATEYLPTRGLPWPTAPKVEPVKARPHLQALPVKAVMWNVYGTLLAIPHGEVRFENDHQFVTDAALSKTIHEFKMWQSMSRKPGAPEEYMRELYKKAYDMLRMTGSGGEKHPEVHAERVWDDIVKKLIQKEYKYDVAQFGAMPEYLKKIAYFYHSSIQGFGAQVNAAAAVRMVIDSGRVNGLLGDGQCFTAAQIHKAMQEQDPDFDVAIAFPMNLRTLSTDCKAKKPSETIFKAALASLAARRIAPNEALHIGSSILRDLAPAKKLGFRTALYAGDKSSLAATAEQLKDPQLRPDVLLTDLSQLSDILA
ncbi:hypothetical protein BH11PLA2_BH11PLA2_07010 [soil metagenome]